MRALFPLVHERVKCSGANKKGLETRLIRAIISVSKINCWEKNNSTCCGANKKGLEKWSGGNSNSKRLLFLVLEIEKGLWTSHMIVQYLVDVHVSCTSVNCFWQKNSLFPSSGRDTFIFQISSPVTFLTSVSESLKDTAYTARWLLFAPALCHPHGVGVNFFWPW